MVSNGMQHGGPVRVDPVTAVHAALRNLGVDHALAKVLTRMAETSARKAKDYANPDDAYANVASAVEFGLPAWVGIGIRLGDKIQRIKAASRGYLANGAVSLANESLEDAFLDTAVYGALGLVMIEKANAAHEAKERAIGSA